MSRAYEPSVWDDVIDLSTIAGSAMVALALTGRLLLTAAPHPVPVDPVQPPPPPTAEVDPVAGADRAYATVTATDGSEVTGYLVWNDARVSWADVLPATHAERTAAAGVRFGRIESIRPLESGALRLELKSGDAVTVTGIPLEGRGGGPLLAVDVEDVGLLAVPWDRVESVIFLSEPEDRAPASERIHGTLMTRSGLGFAGYVTWDRNRGALGDALGSAAGDAISFADVASVRALGPELLGLTLRSGEERVLRGAGIASLPVQIVVADPGLGSVSVPWDRLSELRLHPAETPAVYEEFDGGAPLSGTVITRGGDEFQGRIRWDLDESRSWEMLDGQHQGVQLQVELDQVSRIRRSRWGADVELRDGRSFYMMASNDVSWRNRGIEIVSGAGVRTVEWSDFAELRLDPPR